MTLTVGDMLRRAREKKSISIEQLEKEMRVRGHLLRAIENNNWKPFSSKIYIKGIITSFARSVGVDEKKALVFFRRDYEATEDLRPKRRIPHTLLRPTSKAYAYISAALLGIIFMAYFAYQLSIFLMPPKITVISPIESTFKRRDKITITGKTEREAEITIFGSRVYPNENGVFSYDLPLKAGKNQVVIEAIGANGKKASITQEYVLVP